MARRQDPLRELKSQLKYLKQKLDMCGELVDTARKEKAEGDPEVARRLRERVSELEARNKGLEAEVDGLRAEVKRLRAEVERLGAFEVQAALKELR
jgi:prefoldin subunit 5